MARPEPTIKETRAYKIGARARKFALEGCIIEGYEILYSAIAEAGQIDAELHRLLTKELEKYKLRVAGMADCDP